MAPANLARSRIPLLVGLTFLLAGFTASAVPPESPPAPIVLQSLETSPVALSAAPVFGDVVFGTKGAWEGSEITSGQIVWFNLTGNTIKTAFLGIDATNLYTAAGRGFFAGSDVNKAPMYGGYVDISGFKKMSAPLPANFLSLKAGLSVSSTGYGVVLSTSLSAVLWFQKDYSSPAVVSTVPGSPRAIDFGSGGNWYIGVSNGVQVLTPSWSLVPLPSYTGNTTTVRGCGGNLWLGGSGSGTNYLDLGAFDDFRLASFRRFFTTPYQISSIDCGQDDTIIAVGANRTLFYVDPKSAVPVRGFQLNGTGELIKVSLAPGIVPSGIVLDNRGNLGNFALPADIRYSDTGNSRSTRLINLSPRNLF